MKILVAALMLAVALSAGAAENAVPAGDTVKGEVLETIDANGFTYLRLKTKEGEFWASVTKAAVNKGAEVTVENVMVMKDFKSKSLNRTFPVILLGNLQGAAPVNANPHAAGGGAAANPHAGVNTSKAAEVADAKVPKAAGANARTVAEVITKSGELKDKPVAVRGKIVKYNQGIMGKNWIHLRDGSGSAADNSNDLLVRTTMPAKVGDVVTARGTVRTDQDFGAGYAYKVLVKDAKLQP